MKGRIATAVLVAAASCGLAAPAHAFCLMWDPSAPGGWRDVGNAPRSMPVEAEFARAFTVVTATVRSVRHIPDDELFAYAKYEVSPIETFKGPQLGAFTVVDENDSGRFVMEKGKTYLLFVTAAGKIAEVDNCGWSDEVSAAGETLQRVRALAQNRKAP